jgi:hypothetical protein
MKPYPKAIIPDGAADPGPCAAKFYGVPALRSRFGGDDFVGELPSPYGRGVGGEGLRSQSKEVVDHPKPLDTIRFCAA